MIHEPDINELDIDKLMKSLNDEENEALLKLTTNKIKTIKNNALQQLPLNKNELKVMNEKLNGYRFVDELSDIKFGSYVRWIKLTNPDSIKLTKGGHVTSMMMSRGDACVTCRGFRNMLFRFRLDEVMLFQKHTNQEEILLLVIDYLQK